MDRNRAFASKAVPDGTSFVLLGTTSGFASAPRRVVPNTGIVPRFRCAVSPRIDFCPVFRAKRAKPFESLVFQGFCRDRCAQMLKGKKKLDRRNMAFAPLAFILGCVLAVEYGKQSCTWMQIGK